MSGKYPADWDQRRQEVYERDNYTCQNCGSQGGPHGNAELHAHHIVPKSKGGTHEITNLKTICSDCHSAIHNENVQAPTHPGVQTQDNVPFEYRFPLSKDDYSEELHPKIERANLLHEINEEFGKAEEAYSRLEELFERAFSTKGESDRLKREAREAYEKIHTHFDEIEKLGEKLGESATEDIDEIDEKHVKNVQEGLNRLLPLVRKNMDITYEALQERNSEILFTAEYEFLKEDIEDARESYHNSIETYMNYLSRRFKKDQEPGTEDALKGIVKSILAIGWFLGYVWVGSSISSMLPDDMNIILALIIYPIHIFLAFGVPYIIYKGEWF